MVPSSCSYIYNWCDIPLQMIILFHRGWLLETDRWTRSEDGDGHGSRFQQLSQAVSLSLDNVNLSHWSLSRCSWRSAKVVMDASCHAFWAEYTSSVCDEVCISSTLAWNYDRSCQIYADTPRWMRFFLGVDSLTFPPQTKRQIRCSKGKGKDVVIANYVNYNF